MPFSALGRASATNSLECVAHAPVAVPTKASAPPSARRPPTEDWRIHPRARCSTNRISRIVKAIHTRRPFRSGSAQRSVPGPPPPSARPRVGACHERSDVAPVDGSPASARAATSSSTLWRPPRRPPGSRRRGGRHAGRRPCVGLLHSAPRLSVAEELCGQHVDVRTSESSCRMVAEFSVPPSLSESASSPADQPYEPIRPWPRARWAAVEAGGRGGTCCPTWCPIAMYGAAGSGGRWMRCPTRHAGGARSPPRIVTRRPGRKFVSWKSIRPTAPGPSGRT